MNTVHRAASRRRFLVRSGAGLIVLSGIAASGCNVLFSPDPHEVARELIELLRRHDLARRLGRAYIEAGGSPGEQSLGPLTRGLLKSLGFELDELTFLRVDDLARSLAEQVRRDFAGGSITAVDGWILSQAEAKVCAILYLYEA